MKRLSHFLLSSSNLAGCGSASIMLVLYLTGVVHSYWYILAALAYAGGAIAWVPKAPEHLPEGLNTAETLAWLRARVLPKLPHEASQVLLSILTTADELMPRLKELERSGLVQTENRAMLKQTITKLLPGVVEAYLKLPPVYAKTTRVAGNKTATELLVEQLTLLQTHTVEIRDGLLANDVDTLLASGRFLQEKFAKPFSVLG